MIIKLLYWISVTLLCVNLSISDSKISTIPPMSHCFFVVVWTHIVHFLLYFIDDFDCIVLFNGRLSV